MDNPLHFFWNASLAFLAIAVAIVAFPFTLILSVIVAVSSLAARHRRRQREEAYAWPLHDPRKRRPSGYRRARHGRFYR